MIKRYSILLLLTFAASAVFAQADDISPKRKQAIDSLALEKVRDLSKVWIQAVHQLIDNALPVPVLGWSW